MPLTKMCNRCLENIMTARIWTLDKKGYRSVYFSHIISYEQWICPSITIVCDINAFTEYLLFHRYTIFPEVHIEDTNVELEISYMYFKRSQGSLSRFDAKRHFLYFRNPSVALDILLITFWREISWCNTLSQWCIQKYIHCSYIYFADWLFIFVNSYGVKYMYLAILKTQQVIPGQLYFKNKIL